MGFLSTNDIIMWIDNWASNNPHPQEDDISLFAKNLNEQIAKMDYKVSNGGTVIGYAGKINVSDGETAIFHTVEYTVKNNDGKLCFINNSAENILNNEEFKKSLKAAVNDYYDNIIGGKWDGDVRSKYSFGDNLSLNDFVSDNFMLNNAKGNVILLITDNARYDSTLNVTELERLMMMDDVTHINGIPKAELAVMDSKARFEYLKQDSVIALKNARIYYNENNGSELLSFENTRFSDMLSYDIPEGYKAGSRYGTSVNLLNDTQLKIKYDFLDGCSEAELDVFRGYEYLVSNNADPAAISKTGVMSNAELKSAHSFLIGCSDAEFDAFRGYEFLVSRNADADVISKTGIMTDFMLKSKYSVLQNCNDPELMDSFRIYDYSLNAKTDSDILHNLGFKSREEITLKYNLPDSCSEADMNILGIYDRFMVNDSVSSGSVLPELNQAQKDFFDNLGCGMMSA